MKLYDHFVENNVGILKRHWIKKGCNFKKIEGRIFKEKRSSGTKNKGFSCHIINN